MKRLTGWLQDNNDDLCRLEDVTRGVHDVTIAGAARHHGGHENLSALVIPISGVVLPGVIFVAPRRAGLGETGWTVA